MQFHLGTEQRPLRRLNPPQNGKHHELRFLLPGNRMLKVTPQVRRRFVLGRQGLWPGRRWRGLAGLEQAFETVRAVQVDPLAVIGHSHDLVLESRVEGYRPEHLETLLYRRRAVFEYGGTLFLYPRDTLRLHWSWVHHAGVSDNMQRWEAENPTVMKAVREKIRRSGPLSSSAFLDGTKVDHYRSSRLEGVALHHLWRWMEIMVHHRESNLKYYDLTSRIFGRLPTPYGLEETHERMALERTAWLGWLGKYEAPYLRTGPEGRGSQRAERIALVDRLARKGLLAPVEVEGERGVSYVRTEDLPVLETLSAGNLPPSWKPLSEESEAVLLAPLEVVSSRNRSRSLFGFEYVWEVYKPAHLRRWGYYVLPVLLGDRLVGRIEPQYASATKELRVAKAWWELGVDLDEVAEPLARALARVQQRMGARRIVLGRVGPPAFKTRLSRVLPK